MYYSRMVVNTKSSGKLLSKPHSKAASSAESTAFYSAATYTADQSMGYMFRRITSLLAQGVEREFEPCGLTNAQWLPLLKIYWGHATTVAELARGCDLDAGSMTRLLDRLENKQLLRRVRSSDDRRVVNLELTDAGREAASGIPQVLCKVQNEHLTGFSRDEWMTLVGFLKRILHTAQAKVPSNDKGSPLIFEKADGDK